MKNETKFRMWAKLTEAETGEITMGMLDHDCLLEYTLQDLTDGEDVLMQFIGILDKNGKEIYVGDIIKDEHFLYEILPAYMSYGAYVAVCWNRRLDGTPFIIRGFVIRQGQWEVVGNVYENPDILPEREKGWKNWKI
jgi:uncharacterized phage protein (TIGR01671 family)